MSIRNVFTYVFIGIFAVSASAEPQLAVQLDRSAIYEGESFLYNLVLTDTSPINTNITPDTSAWTDFTVQSLGTRTEQRGGSFFTVIIKGQTVQDNTTASTHLTQFSYRLTPKRTGSQTIPLPVVTVDGKTLLPKSFAVDEESRHMLADYSVAVQVLAPEEQDTVFMSIETNRLRLYPLQPLEVTLLVQIKGLPDARSGTNPLTTVRQPPQLRIPWAVEDPKGFQAVQKLENWLSNLLVRSPQRGFAINDYVSRGLGFNMSFSMDDFFQETPLQFAHAPRQMKRSDAQGKETIYWEYRFSRTFVPQEFGHYSFGPVTLKGVLPIADADVPNGIVGQRIYAVAQPVAVDVIDVPLDHRPADYIGAFGSFSWNVQITPLQAKVGDPMTLTLRLLGEGSTVNVRPMDLSVHPDISANFRVHMPPTEEITAQSCTFTYTVRPQKPGEVLFPPISVSVFDVNVEQFVPLQSLPIPLDIADSETVQSATLFGNLPGDASHVQLAEGGLFANKTVLSDSLPPITFVQWATAISLLAGSYAVIAVGVLLLRCQWTTPQQQRRRGALNRATTRLANISSALRRKDAVNLMEISSELQGVFFGYIADRMDGTEHGMTTSDANQQLREHQVPKPLAEAVRTVLESLDAVKYGGMDIRSLDELTNTAATLLQQLESRVDSPKRSQGRS